ncbi:MAG: hypothetical protein Q4G10_06370 [Bacteroidia bacterium]|nr:hypothetical protein [Bacteroidia bacterium]
MKNKLLTITLAALSIVLAGSCQKDDADNGSSQVLPRGALPGEFSVSATKKVHFSKGNLYYDDGEFMSEERFKLEENQYDYPEIWSDTHVGHFYWSKNDGIARAKYYDDSGASSGDVFFTNLRPFVMSLGSARTLSWREWEYLIDGRKNASNKYGYATVQNVPGIILLPDNFNDPMKNNGSGAFVPKSSTGWEQNVYIGPDWSAMESAGAVFLPAAGCRNIDCVHEVNDRGIYWSSSAANVGRAWYMEFSSYSVSFHEDTQELSHVGRTVRLVTDAN